jgi:hypothetical protein
MVIDENVWHNGQYLGHYHRCTDKEQGIARDYSVDWSSIVLVDFKMFLGLKPTNAVWNSLQQVLDNDQPIKILHLACNNDDQISNTMTEYAEFFKNITWNGQLVMEYFYHHYPGEIAPVVEQLTASMPPGVLQADLYIDGMNLHIKLL